MSEATPINLSAFAPYAGGVGATIATTSSSSRSAIPGLAGGQQVENARIAVTNAGNCTAYVAIGGSAVTASTSSYAILPGTKEVLSPPFNGVGGGALYLAAVTSGSDTTTINVCAGTGT